MTGVSEVCKHFPSTHKGQKIFLSFLDTFQCCPNHINDDRAETVRRLYRQLAVTKTQPEN